MVFVWSSLTKGDPTYTVVQVATNDLIILVAFIPIVKFLLGVSNVSVPWDTLILSVILFVVIPLAGGMLTRFFVINKKARIILRTPLSKSLTVLQPWGFYCADNDFLISGKRHLGKPAAYCFNCNTADFADFLNLCRCILRLQAF